jgi:GntR family transcriptional regulator
MPDPLEECLARGVPVLDNTRKPRTHNTAYKARKGGVIGLARLARSADVPTVPYYQKIVDDIRQQIAAGILKPGQKLPTTRKLAETYDVSLGTVRRAIELLMARDELVGHQGVAVFVPSPPPPDEPAPPA